MKTFKIMRRIHLYTGLFFLVFFMRYAVGAIPFAHGAFFQKIYKNSKPWKERETIPYSILIPENADMRQIGKKILQDFGLDGGYHVYTYNYNKGQIIVDHISFLSPVRLTYYFNENRLLIEDKNFQWNQFLTQFHGRAGFEQDLFLHDAWGVMIDVLALGIVVWIVSGIYMWWQRPKTRRSGIIALAGGFISFVLFIVIL